MPDLLDVNVWVALTVESHTHHLRAEKYWRDEADSEIAFTTVTSLGLTRVISNAKIADGQALSVLDAWTVYRRWREQPSVVFLQEPMACQDELARFVQAGVVTSARWTDAYLVAFAITSEARLVTFDHHFKDFQGLNLLHLEP